MQLTLLFLHLLGDFVLQTDEMAKGKLSSVRVRARHVTLYTLPFLALLPWVDPGMGLHMLGFVWGGHFLIDSTDFDKLHRSPWPGKRLMLDQTAHAAHLALVYLMYFAPLN